MVQAALVVIAPIICPGRPCAFRRRCDSGRGRRACRVLGGPLSRARAVVARASPAAVRSSGTLRRRGVCTASAAAMSTSGTSLLARVVLDQPAEQRESRRASSASVMASPNLATRCGVDVVDTWAAAIRRAVCRVARSIDVEQVPLPRGDEQQRLTDRPARPVRPMRCT